MNKCFVDDYERTFSHKYHLFPCVIRMIRNHELRVLFWLRQYQFGSRIKREFIKHILWHYRRKYGIELPYNPNIAPGSGLRLIHPWNITVNANAILGKNVTLFKGCTIGEILGGDKKGCPTIGNNVTIYANATVCGKVYIGDNVDIASGAFVNFDVPDNSIVLGNPGVIHKKNVM